MARDDSTVKIGLSMLTMGGFFFWNSFRNKQLQRKINDTGTSKIASAALGDCVEIEGRVVPETQHMVRSPLTEKECIAFIWTLEKEVRRRKRTTWDTVCRFYSTPYFYISDDSKGIAAVDLSSCAFQEELISSRTEFSNRSFLIPQKAIDLLKLHNMMSVEKAGFFSSNKFRIVEKMILPGQQLYLLGAAMPVPNTEMPSDRSNLAKFGKRSKDFKDKVSSLLHIRQKNTAVLQKYDTDKNRRLDSRELKALEADIENEIQMKYGQPLDYLRRSKFLLRSSTHNNRFLGMNHVFISTRPQAELAASLGNKSLRDFFLGPALIVGGLWVLVAEYKGRRP